MWNSYCSGSIYGSFLPLTLFSSCSLSFLLERLFIVLNELFMMFEYLIRLGRKLQWDLVLREYRTHKCEWKRQELFMVHGEIMLSCHIFCSLFVSIVLLVKFHYRSAHWCTAILVMMCATEKQISNLLLTSREKFHFSLPHFPRDKYTLHRTV